MINSTNKYKKIAKFSLIAIHVLLLLNLFSVWQTDSMLAPSLVPVGSVAQISKSYLFTSIAIEVLAIAAIAIYFYQKYLVVVIIAFLAILVHMLKHNVFPS